MDTELVFTLTFFFPGAVTNFCFFYKVYRVGKESIVPQGVRKGTNLVPYEFFQTKNTHPVEKEEKTG